MIDDFFQAKKPRTVLVVEAHPDDAAFFAGGTISQLATAGHTIITLCSTYGEKGTLDPTMTPNQMIKIEKDETQRAAAILGIKEILFLEIPDGELSAGLPLRRQYTEIIRRVQPDVVFSFDPNCPYEPHPDHFATGRTIYEACFTSHFPLYYPQHIKKGIQPHYVAKFYGWNSPNPNIYIDITNTLETKIKALEQYKSQIQMLLTENQHRLHLIGKELSALEQLDWQTLLRMFVTITAQTTGKQTNYQYAEAFNAIPLGMVGVIADFMEEIR